MAAQPDVPASSASKPAKGGGHRLNAECGCVTLDRDRLASTLAAAMGQSDAAAALIESRPHLASSQPVFVSSETVRVIASAVRAIETAARLDNFPAPDASRSWPVGAIGAFMGYDFHLGDAGPRLIEINTNAGGALLNAYLREAHRRCCQPPPVDVGIPASLDGVLGAFIAMFKSEWRRAGRAGSPRRVAIVDDAPREQYLYPEFQLFARLFEANGIDAVVADPREFAFEGGALTIDGRPVDLVYNRLTDFDLSEDGHRPLREAYVSGAAVVTPNPWAHARFADKRNLVVLSDGNALAALGLDDASVARVVETVPRTRILEASNAETIWGERDRLFFKPWGGFGGRAAYRGDKMTRKVFAAITGGGYVAQDLVPPSVRTVIVNGTPQQLKTDVRAYTYDGDILLLAARLYQGQTTNFRTPGGGFAPVLVVDDVAARCGCGA